MNTRPCYGMQFFYHFTRKIFDQLYIFDNSWLYRGFTTVYMYLRSILRKFNHSVMYEIEHYYDRPSWLRNTCNQNTIIFFFSGHSFSCTKHRCRGSISVYSRISLQWCPKLGWRRYVRQALCCIRSCILYASDFC